MKKFAAVFCVLFVCFLSARGQLGHEWINFSQSYYKIPVAKDGIYKLGYLDLQNAGFPVGSIDPKTIKIFHRGVEQAIYVDGEADAQLNPVDFIEFYGKRNDGTLDAELYTPSLLQPHLYYNLYNDTTCYFLTFNGGPGKRMEDFSEGNTSSLPKEAFHTDEKLMILKENYATGYISNDIQNAFFDQGEGWTGAQISQNQFIDYTINGLLQGSPGNGSPVLQLLLVGRWTVPQVAEVYVGPTTSSLRLLTTASFVGFQTTTVMQSLNWSDIGGDGKLVVRVRATGTGNRLSTSYIKVNYPQTFDAALANEKVFHLAENAGAKSYIEIENPATGLRLFDISDPSNVVRIGTSQTTTLNAIVPSTTVSRTVFTSNTTITPSLKPVTFRQIIPAQHDYIIISNRLLMKPAPGYSNPVKAYAEYRASSGGGSYDTLVVDMDLLFNQFSYGETTPVAIFHFMKFLVASNTPKYLFLIGKGLNLNYGYYRNPAPFTTYKDLVPSAGMPASDILFTAGLGGTQYEPAVPTGRITANTPAEVAAYLNKVKETEALPYDNLWRKNLLHLSGGIEEGEPEKFKGYLESFGAMAESYYLGGKVTARAKRSREIEQNIDVSAEVNKGLDLITFFGHSSASTLDFDIGFVTNPVLGYDNKGKYPMFLINGCNAGSFFLNGQLFGEDWINAENKGAVGFMAHTFFGLESTLRDYSDAFYQVGYSDPVFIHKGIGDIQKETARRFMDNTLPFIQTITQAQQMILLGDPALKLFGATKPDYEINANNLSIESLNDLPVTALSDSFALKIIVQNFGIAKKDTFRIEVQRTFNDNSVVTYDSLFAPVLYSDTLSFIIRKDRNSGFGNNTFTVRVDPDQVIDELNENNNIASLGLVIPLNATRNLYPYKYAIVTSQQLNLSFQSTDLLSDERDFIVEFDTVDTFSSPFKKQYTVKGTVLAKQAITLLAQDSLAYYWRTKLAVVLPGESEDWETSSFTYIENSPEGWAQVHFPQYLENVSVGLVKDPELRMLKFTETVSDVSIRTFGANHPSVITDIHVKIAGAEYNLVTQGFVCRYNTINLVAFDRRSTVPYIGIPFKWYNRFGRACGREPWVINSFTPTELITGNNDDIVAYVNNIPAGDSVVLYNIGNAGYSSWPAAAKIKLGELGISVAQIDALLPGEPVVIFGRKGLAPGSATIIKASGVPADQQELLVNKTITGRYTSGDMTSTLIGPALEWKSLVAHTSEPQGVDEVSIDVIGVKLNGEEDILFSNLLGDTDLSGVDPAEYPLLKLRYKTKDEIDLTSVQLEKWLVLYEPVAEGILVYKGPREQQILFEGELWKGDYGFVNISNNAFADSLSVNFDTFNSLLHVSESNDFNIKSPAPGDTTWFDVTVNTSAKYGLNDVNVFVNKRILPEQYYDNNVLELDDYLSVITDEFNPVLDVTIDGRHVANNDYVSPNPAINIRLWDENHFLLKKDTIGVHVFIAYPCEGDCVLQRVNFSSPQVTWYPATDSSDFQIIFKPEDLPEGSYTLRVEASDVRGNESGATAYEVNFRVIHETSIEIDSPYPNPTHASSTFRIVISGSELPDSFSLQIISATGTLIRSYDTDSIQPLFIGTNEITWAGTDSNGNMLSSGMYIYQLKLTVSGQELKKVGKIVLIR